MFTDIVDDGKIDKLKDQDAVQAAVQIAVQVENQENFYEAPLATSLSEFFDRAQDERTKMDIVEDFPFMLSHSKHFEAFLNNY